MLALISSFLRFSGGVGECFFALAKKQRKRDPFFKRGPSSSPIFSYLSLQKSADDLLLCFLFGKAKGHQLDELLARDLADRCLVNK